MSYTHSLCDAETYTCTGIYTRAQKGTERQRHRDACCDDLGFSRLSSATALPLKRGSADFTCRRMYKHTHPTNDHVSQLHRKTRKQETYNPHNLPFSSLHPQQTSLFPSSFHASFFIFSSFSLRDIPFHFLA